MQDEAAEKIASEHQMVYFKTSAYKGTNIEEMINYTIKSVYEKKLKPKIEEEKNSES